MAACGLNHLDSKFVLESFLSFRACHLKIDEIPASFKHSVRFLNFVVLGIAGFYAVTEGFSDTYVLDLETRKTLIAILHKKEHRSRIELNQFSYVVLVWRLTVRPSLFGYIRAVHHTKHYIYPNRITQPELPVSLSL